MKPIEIFSLFSSVTATAFYAGIAFSLLSSENPLVCSVNLLIFAVLVVLLPTASVIYLWRGNKADLNVSDRKTRQLLYDSTVAGAFVSTAVFLTLKNRIMFDISLSYLLMFAAFSLINTKWKISMHASGVTLPITALSFVLGPEANVFHLLVVPVMWMRVRMKVHTWAQVIAGSVLAFLLASLVYSL
ncbi:MAG: hypothetical protein QXO69_01140 [archaeon]